MKVAVVTMNVKQGKCEENVSYMKEMIQRAREEHADLIVFPQNAVSGYRLGDQWLDDAWCRYVDHFNEELIAESEDIAIVWGNIRYRNHRRFNAAFFAYQKQTHMRVKRNDAAFDDARYFEENPINSAIEFKGRIFGLNFGREVQLTDININLDAAMFDLDADNNLKGNVIYANAVGMQNCGKNVVVMQGGSGVRINKKTIYHAPWFKSEMQIVDLDAGDEVSVDKPSLFEALKLGIQEFDKQVFGGTIPWIVGMSGGLDSSVTTALLCAALGKERVYGYNIATHNNSSTTIQNAAHEAKALGIAYQEGNMESLIQASVNLYKNEYGYDVASMPSLVMENIQARARGYLLSGFAGILGGVVVNNGNKVETALGYCTLYGDSIGAISVIGDLTKVQLFELANEINAYFDKEIVPVNLLPNVLESGLDWKMPPSAELREQQFDPMKWFYHDYIIEHLGKDISIESFMQSYLDKSIWNSEISRWLTYYSLDDPKKFIEDLEWILSTMNKNGFKRLQLPPLLSVHKHTLANKVEAQMSVDQHVFNELKDAILHE